MEFDLRTEDARVATATLLELSDGDPVSALVVAAELAARQLQGFGYVAGATALLQVRMPGASEARAKGKRLKHCRQARAASAWRRRSMRRPRAACMCPHEHQPPTRARGVLGSGSRILKHEDLPHVSRCPRKRARRASTPSTTSALLTPNGRMTPTREYRNRRPHSTLRSWSRAVTSHRA